MNYNNKRSYGRRRGNYSRPRNGTPVYNPMMFVRKGTHDNAEEYVSENVFNGLNLDHKLKENISQKGFKSMTEIQDRAIPVLLQGGDVIGIAATGTGKTAAFLIPLIDKVRRNPREKVLIIAPTRELSLQVEKELQEFTRGMNIRSVNCIGGVNINTQINKLRSNASFVLGTPGRLLDLEKRRVINFSVFGNIVLDEVDRMLDMGFIKDITYIVSKLPARRQSLFFSATLSQKADMVAKRFVHNPDTITVKKQSPSSNVDQDIIRLAGREKSNVLIELLRNQALGKVLVFGKTKRGIEKLGKILLQKGMNVETIHGNKTQGQRKRALDQFRSDKVRVLLATDVASRGLDIDNITHVINFDLPQSYDDYIHRIGRTGRANNKGYALTFVD